MREKQVSVQSDENDIQVKLKPIFGIRPGVYLTALYSFVLLIILFFLLLYPGIKNPGVVLTVKTEPAGAAIRVNDVYRGLSGNGIFVSRGTHTIEAVMPGFEGQSIVLDIPGRLFGSKFFPIRKKVEFTLTTADPAAAFAYYASDFAVWTFMGEPTAVWQVPMSLSDGAYRVGPYVRESSKELNEILRASSRFASTRAALRDLLRAKILLDNNGGSPAPTALFGSISDILTFLSENPNSAWWLADLLPQEAANIVKASAWYENPYQTNHTVIDGLFDITTTARSVRQRQIAGISFVDIEPGERLTISEYPVSRSLFETFLNQNPQWREHQTDYFPNEISINPAETLGNNITGITWYAADAFCKWLTIRLPSSLAGHEVRLPTEDEWLRHSKIRINNIQNSAWEWCADPYVPLNFISASQESIEIVGSLERSLRRSVFSSSEETRASLPPDISSPFVTFRVVIAPVNL